jgi:hypothetical protein
VEGKKTKKEGYRKEGKEECEEEVPNNPLSAEEQEPLEDGWFSNAPNRYVSLSSGRKSLKG